MTDQTEGKKEEGRIGMWVEGISYHNHYQEFETELNHTPHSVISQRERDLESEGLAQSYTPRPSSDSNSKNGTKERFDRL